MLFGTAVLPLCFLSSLAAGEEPLTLLHPLETTDGLTLSWGSQCSRKELVVNTDPQWVSEGAASVRLIGAVESPPGNQYLAVKIPLPLTDLANGRLVFDAWSTTPETTQALYVRWYNAAGECVASWVHWGSPFAGGGKRTFEFQNRISRQGFAYEPQEIVERPLTEVTLMEIIIGTSEKEVTFDVILDNLRRGPAAPSVGDLKTVKPRFPETPLGGSLMVYPESPVGQAQARRVRDRLAEWGVEPPELVPSPARPDQFDLEPFRSRTVIALGNLNNNALLFRLYGQGYTAVDAFYPGAGGFVVHTVHDPWGTGKNVIVLGGSDDAGLEVAVGRFLSLAADPLPPTFEAEFGPHLLERLSWLRQEPDEEYVAQQLERGRTTLAQGGHTGVWSQVADVGLRYVATHREGYARLFVALVDLAYEHYQSKPDTYGGPWGMDSDFTVYRVLPAWDVVEECPAVTDEDRLRVTRILARWVSEDCAPKAQSVRGNERVRFNHQTFPALGLLFAGTYFQKYYRAVEAEEWLETADACFQMQARAFKVHEDCNGYQWLSQDHLLRYVLAKPDFTYFENGNARRAADYAVVCMDNLGYQVPYGDTGSWQCWWSELPFLKAVKWGTRDPGYQWVVDKKMAVSPRYGLFEYACDLPAEEPTALTGVQAVPLDEYYYRTFGGPDYLPLAKCVDKVVFRDRFDPQAEYLLLDGLSNGGHKHYDGNSISRITWADRIWLADNDYIKSLPKFHNGVLIFKDGQSQTIPPFVELEYVGETDKVGFSKTALRNYAGVDWHRNILWRKGKEGEDGSGGFFIVIDEMVAQEADEYSFRCLWHTVGDVSLSDAGLALEQKGVTFHIRHAPGPRLKLTDDPELGGNWSGYPYAEPVVHTCQQIAEIRLAEGESYPFCNVLGGHAPTVQRLANAPRAFWLEDAAGSQAVGVGNLDMPGLRVGAEAWVITAESLTLLGGREAVVEGRVLHRSEAPADVTLDLPGGAAVLARLSEQRLAAAPAAAATVVADVPPLTQLWSYREKLSSFLLTGNAGHFEAIDTGFTVAAQPEPRPENVFGKPGEKNDLAGLTDGELLTTEGGVQWDDDQVVTLTFDLQQPYDLHRVAWKQWWADSSSKGQTYQLASAVLEVSDDNFAADVRRVGELRDTERHGNWGAPGYGPVDYAMGEQRDGETGKPKVLATARYVRLTLTPRPGTGVYLSELEIWGHREGLEADRLRPLAGVPIHTFVSLATADLDGDGKAEVIAGSTNKKVYAFDHDGSLLWTFETGGTVHSVAAGDLNGDGRIEVVAGSHDTRVYALDARGQELWRFEVPYYKRAPIVRTVFLADLEGDGRQEVIAGADSWRYYALDAEGNELWHYESVHGSTAGVAADLDGDGRMEVVCGTEYYWWPCVNADGTLRWSYSTSTGPRVNSVAAGDVDGDGQKEVIFGGADANVHVVGADGKLRWQYNTGDEIKRVRTADVDGDGVEEIIVGSMSFNVYVLKGDGTRLWRRDLGDVVTEVVAADLDGGGRPPRGFPVVAGTEDGRIEVLDATGQPQARFMAGGKILQLAVGDLDGDGTPELVVSAGDGNVSAWSG